MLNVVIANVKRQKEKDGDSHNLGKTTLIHLIDFLFLRDVSDGTHFLVKHSNRFSNFIFFIEIVLNDGGFVTVRRAVSQPTKIAFKKSPDHLRNFRNLAEKDWDHWDVTLENARNMLDGYLNLKIISPWGYRKGISYFLRTQEDYTDYFQIQKFLQGKDREWKPYLACVLGLDHEAVHQKYVLDEQIEADIRLRDQKKSEITYGNADRGALATRIDIARDEIAEMNERLDGFDFQEEEQKISKKVVDEIEARVSDINSELYDVDSDVSQLQRSIASGIKFDMERIANIFEESKIALPDAITRSYEELVDFNKRLTKERNAALKQKITELVAQRDSLIAELTQLNDERQRLLHIIKNADTFRKYKLLQKEYSERRGELTFLEGQLARIDAVEAIDQRLRERRQKRDEQITAIEVSLQRGSPIKTAVTQLFNRYVKQVLNINGEFIVGKNKSGNLEFEIRTKDVTGADTSQHAGHSYHRLLCALFDIAVLKALENTAFYHFVYHDGIFEGFDNRAKLRLLELIRECIASSRIQYILSIIDSDLPRALHDDNQKIYFSPDEIVVALNDSGDEGRLFKMPPF